MTRQPSNQNDTDRYLDRQLSRATWQIEQVYAEAYRRIRLELMELFEFDQEARLTASQIADLQFLFQKQEEVTRILVQADESAYRLAQTTFEEQALKAFYESSYVYEAAMGTFGGVSNEAVQAAVTNGYEKIRLSDTSERNKRLTREAVRRTVAVQMTVGGTYRDIAAELLEVTNFSKNRTMTVARTEGHRAAIKGRALAVEEQRRKGRTMTKMWDATLDGRTRSAHQKLDGTVIELDASFTSDNGGSGPYPGEMNNASDDINCRCVVLYLINGRKPSVRNSSRGQVQGYLTYEQWQKQVS